MFFRRHFTPLIALLAWVPTLGAQKPRLAVVPRAGETVQVRVEELGTKIVGKVVSIGPDSMTIRFDRDTVLLPSRMLVNGQVRTDSRTAARTGLAIGASVGLLVGFIAGSSDRCSECWFDISPVASAAGGAILGGGAGIIIGMLFKKPLWSRAAAPAPSSGVFNGPLGAGDAVRLIGHDRNLNGIVTGGAGDTAIVQLASGTDTAVALASLERYMGERLNRGKNLVFGAASGAILGVLSYAGAKNNGEEISAGQAVGRSVLLTAFGAGLGYLTGNMTRQAWTPVVPAPARRLAITPLLGPARVGLAARLEF